MPKRPDENGASGALGNLKIYCPKVYSPLRSSTIHMYLFWFCGKKCVIDCSNIDLTIPCKGMPIISISKAELESKAMVEHCQVLGIVFSLQLLLL